MVERVQTSPNPHQAIPGAGNSCPLCPRPCPTGPQVPRSYAVLPLVLTPYALGSALTLPHTAKMLAPPMVIGNV